MIEHIKMQRTHNGRVYTYGAAIERKGGRITFIESPFKMKDEIKAMKGSHWHGRDEKPLKIWSVADCCRNNFQLEYLSGGNPYAHFDRPIQENTFERPLFEHQKVMVNHILTYNCGILAAEPGAGKTLVSVEAMERSGHDDWWFCGPKSAIEAIKMEFIKWDCNVKPRLMTYQGLVKIVKEWKSGDPAPHGVIFDESSRLKGPTSQRTQAAMGLADAIRNEWEYDGYIVLMSGTPSPKSPIGWWSQCLAGDTWVLTESGPCQIQSSTETNVHVKDANYPSTPFFSTGFNELFELETVEGYSVKATADHRFLKSNGDWCELKDLKPGDDLELANHDDFDWEGVCTFEDGWALGFLVGDGTVYTNKDHLYAKIKFYPPKEPLIPIMETYFQDARATKTKVIQFKHLTSLVRRFGFGKRKVITPEFESKVSSKCLKGFLRGFFDADGHAEKSRLRVRLTQVNLERLKTVQRMLTYFGIRSSISKIDCKRGPSIIKGHVFNSAQIYYILTIVGDDARRFHTSIGFNLDYKARTLKERVEASKNWLTTSTVKISNITSVGVAETFDVTVPKAKCFAANGLIAHNCEIACPGFIREGTPKAFEYRLGLFEKVMKVDGFYWDRITWLDDEKKCAICGQLECTGDHEYKPSINEVAYLDERMSGLVLPFLKKDVLDLPDMLFRVIECKPTRAISRVAKALIDIAPTAIQALTWSRELSDGFQYQQVKVGMKICPVCEGQGGDCEGCEGTGEVDDIQQETIKVPCPKDKVLKELLEENEEQGRIVIFAGFTGSIDRVREVCLGQGWDVAQVDGRGWKVHTKDGVKQGVEVLKYWASDAQRVAFVAHPQSGGMGLTLTEARMAVFYSNDFNPESRYQAMCRIHRPGMDYNKGATIVDIDHLPTDKYIRGILDDNRRLELLTLGEIPNE